MKYVVDCSVVVKWAVAETGSDKAVELRDGFVRAVHELLAPDLFPTEIANALVMAERRGRVSPGQGVMLLRDILTTLPVIHPALPDLLPRAYAIADQTQRSVYDCLYVALAEREGCELVTADTKLVNAVQPSFPFVVDLAQVP